MMKCLRPFLPIGAILLGSLVAVSAKDASPPEIALPVGEWTVEFTNGVKEVCDIFNFDGGHVTVDEPQRRSRGTVAKHGMAFVLTFHDDRVERWTPVGSRYIVEHWFPGSQFPRGKPVLGIADRIQR